MFETAILKFFFFGEIAKQDPEQDRALWSLVLFCLVADILFARQQGTPSHQQD